MNAQVDAMLNAVAAAGSFALVTNTLFGEVVEYPVFVVWQPTSESLGGESGRLRRDTWQYQCFVLDEKPAESDSAVSGATKRTVDYAGIQALTEAAMGALQDMQPSDPQYYEALIGADSVMVGAFTATGYQQRT